MISLFNKKTTIVFSLVLPFILSNYAIATFDASLESIEIKNAHDDNIYSGGDSFYVSCKIKNTGDEPIYGSNYIIRIYAGDYLIGSKYGVSIGIGEEKTVDVRCELKTDIPNNSYTIWGKLFITDSDSNNNVASISPDIIVLTLPDIAVKDVDVLGGNYFKQGDSIVIQTLIKNHGYITATNISVEYYIDNNMIGSTSRSDLDSKQEDTFRTVCKIPDSLPDNYYTVRAEVACTDDENADNNEFSSSSFWIGSRPDLEVQSVQAANGTYMPGDEIVIYSLVKNIGDDESNAYTIDFYASIDETITTQDYHIGYVEREGLAPGEQKSCNTSCSLPLNIPAAECYIGIIVTSINENSLNNNSGYDSDAVQCIHPENYICGHIDYAFPDYNNQAIRYALVKFSDTIRVENSYESRYIGQTYTDNAGNYGAIVPIDELSTTYVRVHVLTKSGSDVYPGANSAICTVMSETLEQVYRYTSRTYIHPQGGSLIVNMTIPDNWRPFLVFDSIIQSFHKAKKFFGIEMEEINTYWPSQANASYYYPDVGIFISRDDEWDRDLIMHEYGHYIATVYDFAQGDVGDDPRHYWDYDLRYHPVDRTEEHASNLAFRESWPTLFSIAAQYGDKNYPHSGDTMYQDYYSYYDYLFQFDLEQDTFDNDSPGEYYGNMNCCSLWDIFDDNRDRLSFQETVVDPGLDRTWTIMRDRSPKNLNDFWISWYNRFYDEDDIEGVKWIFSRHNMTFAESSELPPTSQNHAPVANAGPDQVVEQNRLDGAVVYLNANGSYDPDGDGLSYTWRRYSEQYQGKNVQVLVPVGYATFELEITDGEFKSWDTVEVQVIAAD